METHDSVPASTPRSSRAAKVSALAAALRQSQIEVEAEKGALVRMLHDDIGGLLVGAIMDMGWIANQPDLTPKVKEKLARAQMLMREAIDMKRELIESLRPTLLDNVGLYPTLRWHMKASCAAASVAYTESFPELEVTMAPEIRIGVFRIFQEALKDVLSERMPSELSVRVEVRGNILHCDLVHQSEGRSGNTTHFPSPETSMHCRAERVGGTLQWSKTQSGRRLHLQVPLRSEETQFSSQ